MELTKIINHNAILGIVGTSASFILSHYDKALAGIAAILTIGILCIRIRKEWRHRND